MSTLCHGATAQRGRCAGVRCVKQRSEPSSDKRGTKAGELTLTPLELIDRIAALVPPLRTHRPATLVCWPRIRRSGLRRWPLPRRCNRPRLSLRNPLRA